MLLDPDTEEYWTSLYRCELEDGRVAHYERAAKEKYLGQDHWRLLDTLGIQKGAAITLIGAGFGWVGEDWLGAGYGPIVCADTSAWIRANLTGNAIVPILSENALSVKSRKNIRNAAGTAIIWAISEDALAVLEDSEAITLSVALHQLAPNVVHWVSENVHDPRLNPNSAAAWKVVLPDDIIVGRGSGEKL